MIFYLALNDRTIRAATSDPIVATAIAQELPKGRAIKIDVNDNMARRILRELKGGIIDELPEPAISKSAHV